MDIPLFTGKIEPIKVEQKLFTFDFTLDKFSKVIKNKNSKEWFEYIYNILPRFEITNKNRVAGFLAQTGHESLDYTVISENLNYSAQGLMKTWPSRFPNKAIAFAYARNPQKIANKVYANRLGNGPETSGDGWNFRGKGLIQLTGKSNHMLASQQLYGDDRLVKNPELILNDKTICVEVSCWFWKTNGLNLLADKKDVIGMTKRINGGTIGLTDRTNRWNNAQRVL